MIYSQMTMNLIKIKIQLNSLTVLKEKEKLLKHINNYLKIELQSQNQKQLELLKKQGKLVKRFQKFIILKKKENNKFIQLIKQS
ncbi:unnamed protein product [Paramecium sonneborni]|uniref:Uncharacterized protein n=1 Tax=Paramecium sonneborni TaxID=65129 RepID=A0A8S1L7S0_9CILI|nr:unnamed protein product [Paramecium sonneborni]